MRLLAVTCISTLIAAAQPARGEHISIDALLARMLQEPHPEPYTLTADFTAAIAMRFPGGSLAAGATGSFIQSRSAAGQPSRRKATISRLDLPLALQPFSEIIRRFIVDLVEAEHRPGDHLPQHDIFIVEARAPGRHLIGGVRTDIVTQAMIRYGRAALVDDIAVRRAIARWLWSPIQRPAIVRPGPGPYMIAAVVDGEGLVHELVLSYDWGQVGSRISFVAVGGRPFWREAVINSSFKPGGVGRVDARMVLRFQNHCLDCPTR
jgi:hypothetical protein